VAPPAETAATNSGAPTGAASGPVPGAGLVQQLVADPRYAPELLALAAVRRLGPAVAHETRWLRATYPNATPAALADYAHRRQVRRVGYATLVSATTGLFAPATGLAALLWSQAQIVLRTAAAYGRDPADPARAAELLTILGVRASLADAVAAVDAALAGPDGTVPDPTELVATGWRLAALAGPGRLATVPLRLIRGATLVASVSIGTAEAERTARRAAAFYRP
jgi:hypothetical protein